MISVLTVSKRTGWESLARRCLSSQTFQDFEWVIVVEDPYVYEKMTFHAGFMDINDRHTKIILAPKKIRKSNLSASDNEGLRHCSGEYVVFYQDFIELENDCLEKLVSLATPTTLVTTLTRNPEGDEEDPRYTWQDEVRACEPGEWEENVGLIPMQVIKDLGGYDEEYDNGWAWNNCNVAERAEMLGCKFLLDETNRPQLVYHRKEPELHPEIPLNGEFHDKRMQDIRGGKYPLKLNYL